MASILIGVLAAVIGALFCFRGVVAMRVMIAVWGTFVGFNLGAGLVAAFTGDDYLSTVLGWIVGVIVAALFAFVAYLYYVVGVTLAMASIGFAIGTALIAALGVTWSWVVILVGVIAGVLLAVAAIKLNLPSILLVVLSAIGGSTAIVGGLMLMVRTIALDDFNRANVTATMGHGWWWYLLYLALIIAGVLVQVMVLDREKSLQQQW